MSSKMEDMQPGKVTLENGVAFDGFVRKDNPAIGTFYWQGPLPPWWAADYHGCGWVEVRDGRIVNTFFAKIGEPDRSNPNNPPLLGV